MLNIDIIKELKIIIEKNTNEIEINKKQIVPKYTQDDFIKKNSDELEKIAREYNIFNIESMLEVFKIFEIIKDIDIKDSMHDTYINCSEKIAEMLSEVNDKIEIINSSINEKIIILQQIKTKCEKIISFLNSNELYDIEKFREIYQYALELDIPDDIKIVLSIELSKHFIYTKKIEKLEPIIISEEMKESIDDFEEAIGTIYDSSEEIIKLEDNISEERKEYIEYANAIKNREGFIKIIELDSEDLEIIEQLSIVDEKDFQTVCSCYIQQILDVTVDDKIAKDCYEKLKSLIEKYENCVEKKKKVAKEINNIEKFFDEHDSHLSVELYVEFDEIKKIYNNNFILTEEIYNYLLEKLNAINYELSKKQHSKIKFYERYTHIGPNKKPIKEVQPIEEVQPIVEDQQVIQPSNESYYTEEQVDENYEKENINSFLLFAEEDGKSYFDEDIFNPKSKMIDKSVITNYDYLSEFNNLINDLFKYGQPSILQGLNSSQPNFSEKICSQICYLTSKGEVDRSRPTDMWRIRPLTNSNVRFSERKIIIPTDTKLFSQVSEIIKKYFKNINIEKEDTFTLVVNIGAAVKKKDEELYKSSIKRYDSYGIPILSLFYENGKYNTKIGSCNLKTQFTEEECQLFEEYVKNAFELLKTLENGYDQFNFGNLTKGGAVYGPQK